MSTQIIGTAAGSPAPRGASATASRYGALTAGLVAVLTAVSAMLVMAGPATAARSVTVGGAKVQLVNAGVRPATLGRAGAEMRLSGKGSSATTRVVGPGRVQVAAAGVRCHGVPQVAVSVDGRRVAKLRLTSRASYRTYTVGPKLRSGAHRVAVRLVNAKRTRGCARAALVARIGAKRTAVKPAAASAPVSAATPAATGTRHLSVPKAAGTIGVATTTGLKVYRGDLTITTAGTVIDGWNIYGDVNVKADNVTIRNSYVHGGAASTTTDALIKAWWKRKNLVVQNTTLRADNPSLHLDGISGSGFTANGVDISNVVDSVKVIGPNVVVANSHLHGNVHSDNDPNQSNGRTHDDGIQIEGGTNIVVSGNTVENAHNAAIQVTQNYSATANLQITGNVLRNGACSINTTQLGLGAPIKGMSITKNRFGAGSYGKTCPMRLPKASAIAVSGNLWESTTTTAVPNWF